MSVPKVQRLIYTSRATVRFNLAGLERMMVKSRSNNRRNGITGLLCFWNGSFAQCLEGCRDEVTQTYSRIQGDPRHEECRVLLEAAVEERHFGDWSMRLVSLDEVDAATSVVKRKYPPLDPGLSVFRDPLVVFSLLFDLGYLARAA